MAGTRKLFKPVKYGRRAAVLNWYSGPLNEFALLAKAFHETAKRSAAALKRKGIFGGSDDVRACAIVFLYRHSVELALKAVIVAGAPLIDIQQSEPIHLERVRRQHSLEALRQDVERVFAACGWSGGFGVPHFRSIADFRQAIREFDEIDPHPGVAFRYLVDRKGTRVLPRHLRFDFVEFCNVLDALVPVLVGAAGGAEDHVAAANEP